MDGDLLRIYAVKCSLFVVIMRCTELFPNCSNTSFVFVDGYNR